MGGFGIAFNSAANGLGAIQQALDAVQNNIVNANTPGYAAERANFSAEPFDPNLGLWGGSDVTLSSTRDEYLEQAVRTQTTSLGLAEQKSPLLATLQSAFSVSGDSGVPGAFSNFASSFSALAAAPNDASAGAGAIQAASALALAFNQTASQISQVGTEAAQQASATTQQINALASHIGSLNAKIQNGAQNDAGVAADLNQSLESLSELVNVSVTSNSDGTASVLLDGQSPLVLGAQAYTLAVQQGTTKPGLPYALGDTGIVLVIENQSGGNQNPQAGTDITGQATGGKLGAALAIRNQTVPYYLGTQTQQGELNQLAQSFASQVNDVVTGAQTAAGATVLPLFTYSPDGSQVASTLAVGPITAAQIVNAGGTSGASNGVATELAGITSQANLLANQSFNGFYGQLAAQAGTDASQASEDLTTQQDLTTQAQNQRAQVSGVSLDDQAAQVLSLQQAYQATAKIITILESLSQTAVNLIPQS